MKRLEFKKDINASAEKVYNTMLGLSNIETYEQWTSVFNPSSTYEGNWEKGSKIYFVGTDENGKKGGMISEIVDNIPFSFVSIRHYGVLDGENETTEGAEVEKWAGGLENYTFEENNGVTTVTIAVDAMEDYLEFFNKSFPKALEKLKEVAEK
ncbi:MAG: SRPBCC domain-containing protein [Salinimicrobium sp.]